MTNVWQTRTEGSPSKCLESWFQVIVHCHTACRLDTTQPTQLGIYYWGTRCDHKTSLIRRLYDDARKEARSRNEKKRLYYRYYRMCVLTRPYKPDSCNFDIERRKPTYHDRKGYQV